MKLAVLLVLSGLAGLAADAGLDLFQRASTLEHAGKIDEAIKLYKKVAHDYAADRPLAAKALVQAARDYEKLGQDKTDRAVELYQQVTREYSDQHDSAEEAQKKLAALLQPPSTTTLRQITPLGFTTTQISNRRFLSFRSDGQHALYSEKNALVSSDLSGKNKRV